MLPTQPTRKARVKKPVTSVSPVEPKQAPSDLKVVGSPDAFQLISECTSRSEGWVKSTRAMQIDGLGCLVQVSTRLGANMSEAVTFVLGVKIKREPNGNKRLIAIK